MASNTLTDAYFRLIERVIDEDGVYPHQMISRAKDDSLQMSSLVIDVPELITAFWNKLGESEEVIVGIDMTTRPNQGTLYRDALVLARWTRVSGKKLTDPSCLKVGVINYSHEPRVIEPIDWTNTYWDQWIRSVFSKYCPALLVRVEQG